MSRPIAGVILMAFALVLFPMSVSLGHAELASGSPSPGESLDVPPTALVAHFTQDLRQDRTSIEVRDATGATVARGGRDPDRHRVQRADLPLLEPGEYEVRWITWSAEDDEFARGRYRFTIAEGSATTAEAVDPSPCPWPTEPAMSPSAAPEIEAAEVSPMPMTVDDGSIAASLSPLPSATPHPCTWEASPPGPEAEEPSAPPSPDGSPTP